MTSKTSLWDIFDCGPVGTLWHKISRGLCLIIYHSDKLKEILIKWFLYSLRLDIKYNYWFNVFPNQPHLDNQVKLSTIVIKYLCPSLNAGRMDQTGWCEFIQNKDMLKSVLNEKKLLWFWSQHKLHIFWFIYVNAEFLLQSMETHMT